MGHSTIDLRFYVRLFRDMLKQRRVKGVTKQGWSVISIPHYLMNC